MSLLCIGSERRRLRPRGIPNSLSQDLVSPPTSSSSAAPEAQPMAGSPGSLPSHRGVSLYRKESQTLENNFREILFLIEQIDVLKALLRDMQDGLRNYSWNVDRDEDQEPLEATDEVRALGRVALHGFWEQKTQALDALSSSGRFSLTGAYLKKACPGNPLVCDPCVTEKTCHPTDFLPKSIPDAVLFSSKTHRRSFRNAACEHLQNRIFLFTEPKLVPLTSSAPD